MPTPTTHPLYPIQTGFHGPERPVPNPALVEQYNYRNFTPFPVGGHDVDGLKTIAQEIRRDIIRMLVEAKSGHSGGPLGIADILSVLYFSGIMRHDPTNPWWSERDRFVISAGHLCPGLYAVLANAGYFPKEELLTLRKFNSRLQGHPGRDMGLPGIETTTASLGQGISIAVGMAMSDKLIDKNNHRVYSLTGDGELQEGSCWEAIMCAGHYKLDNLINIVDRNHCQIDGRTDEVMDVHSVSEKFRAFNWHVIDCNGNSIPELIASYNEAMATKGKPTCIVATTYMGNGVSFMQDDYRWHGKPPTPEEAVKALTELGNN